MQNVCNCIWGYLIGFAVIDLVGGGRGWAQLGKKSQRTSAWHLIGLETEPLSADSIASVWSPFRCRYPNLSVGWICNFVLSFFWEIMCFCTHSLSVIIIYNIYIIYYSSLGLIFYCKYIGITHNLKHSIL